MEAKGLGDSLLYCLCMAALAHLELELALRAQPPQLHKHEA